MYSINEIEQTVIDWMFVVRRWWINQLMEDG